MSRRLYICVRQNHPWAKYLGYYEEENGLVQQVEMKQQGNAYVFDGYVGLMFPFSEIRDACILADCNPENYNEVGILNSKIPQRNDAHKPPDWDEESVDI